MYYDVAIIGGGFFGCELAVHLQRQHRHVILLEEAADILQRASYGNQARVHHGYHYPRSLLTAYRSQLNFGRFVADYDECISRDFTQHYAIARKFSKVSAAQFHHFCRRIGAPVRGAAASVQCLFNPELIEEVFAVEEYAFDAARLRGRLKEKLDASGVCLRLRTHATRVVPECMGRLDVYCTTMGREDVVSAREVFLCTYANLNDVLANSELPLIPLKHELAELALVEVPETLRKLGVTVMCGPFFSFMPFPSRGLHSFSHVRYTPHCAWQEGPDARPAAPEMPRTSSFGRMLRDACRYMPCLQALQHVESLWEVKTVLPRSEADDSRPILFRKDHGIPGLHCVLGAKLDNIYDALSEADELHARREAA